METKIAIKASNLSKKFVIPHLKINTLRGAFVNIFNKKTFENFNALDNVSFEVNKGDFFAIIGENGSGKSTLLKILAGVYEPDAGQVEINGEISPLLELGIGFNPELSGRDNIFLNGLVIGLSKKQIEKNFNNIVEFSGIGRFIDQKLKNYSSGMASRLAFSIMINANKDILIIDEVLAVGDLEFAAKCMEVLCREISLGKTILYVSHALAVVEQFANKAILLDQGKIAYYGAPREAIKCYNSLLSRKN